jgi:hypothetical protein
LWIKWESDCLASTKPRVQAPVLTVLEKKGSAFWVTILLWGGGWISHLPDTRSLYIVLTLVLAKVKFGESPAALPHLTEMSQFCASSAALTTRWKVQSQTHQKPLV